MHTIHFVALAAAAACALTACTFYEPDSPVAGLTRPIDPPRPPDLGHGPAHLNADYFTMFMTDGVHRLCEGPDPYFKFDSSVTGAKDQPTMQVLANCLDHGPLQGRTIRLVGRTDPRGGDAFNERLGLQRADQVKRYLVDHGIAPERVEIASAGKTDANPLPKDWPTDRRVDVELVP